MILKSIILLILTITSWRLATRAITETSVWYNSISGITPKYDGGVGIFAFILYGIFECFAIAFFGISSNHGSIFGFLFLGIILQSFISFGIYAYSVEVKYYSLEYRYKSPLQDNDGWISFILLVPIVIFICYFANSLLSLGDNFGMFIISATKSLLIPIGMMIFYRISNFITTKEIIINEDTTFLAERIEDISDFKKMARRVIYITASIMGIILLVCGLVKLFF